ncbi:MAG: acyltransferase domain-containing protein [Cellulomonas sp.]
MNEDEIFDLLAVAEVDRAGCRHLLGEAASRATVGLAEAELSARLGSFSVAPPSSPSTDAIVWLTAFLHRTPAVAQWYRDSGVPDDIIRATFADVGRNLTKSRRTHGSFGLETWDWLIPHYTGMMFALGRLNFMLHPAPAAVEGVLAAGEWYLGIHIPESGPLAPAPVDASLAQAQSFFAEVFPAHPVGVAVCESWLLDPGMVSQMPAGTNLGSFGRRFTPLAAPYGDATAALYFVFRTRDLGRLASLPRDTTLQRLVLDRAHRAGSGELGTERDGWQIGTGYLRL